MILRYLHLRGLDRGHPCVYPRRSLGLVNYSEPHIHITTDLSYRSVFVEYLGFEPRPRTVWCLHILMCFYPFFFVKQQTALKYIHTNNYDRLHLMWKFSFTIFLRERPSRGHLTELYPWITLRLLARAVGIEPTHRSFGDLTDTLSVTRK